MARSPEPGRPIAFGVNRFSWEIFLRWVFGDVAYAVLPLAATAMLVWLLRRPWEELVVSPEWAFASIICFGLSIRSLIELKVRHQHDFSFKLDTGSQGFVVLLIASVLALAMAQLHTWHLLPPTWEAAKGTLVAVQIALLVIGAGSLFAVTYYRELIIQQRETFPQDLSKQRYSFCLERNLADASHHMGAALVGARQIAFFLDRPNDDSLDPVAADRLRGRLEMLLDEIDAASGEVRELLAARFTESPLGSYVRVKLSPPVNDASSAPIGDAD